ncbi:MAG: hypothetical protein R3C39_11980 [Dehalococcoidia bacterium]
MKQRNERPSEKTWRWMIAVGVLGIVYDIVTGYPGAVVTTIGITIFNIVGLRTHGRPEQQRRWLLIVIGFLAAWNVFRLGRGLPTGSPIEAVVGAAVLVGAVWLAMWTRRITSPQLAGEVAETA